ncbi:MAG: ribulose-phosphate 3-epimerase [Actinomycetota bacterium]|jgi:ribulose-phosphate 3-epimerase
MTMRIQPSILSADFVNFESEFKTISAADGIHVDVMDGHFVPNLTFGLGMVKRMQEITTLPLDVHLMIENPDQLAAQYAEGGVFSVTVHFEALTDPIATAKAIKSKGARAGLSIKPNTPVADIDDLIQHFDQILVMSVEPGFGGQAFMPSSIEKISTIRNLIDSRGLATWLQVDGGIDLVTIGQAASAGADTFVAGSSVFGSSDRNEMIRKLRVAAESAVSSS